jgi:hypothetical protein
MPRYYCPPGDFNQDGKVDAADYTLWADHYGVSGINSCDGNKDRIVDIADYTIWADHYSESTFILH